MPQIVPIVIDIVANTLFYGTLWSFGLYLASACIFFAMASRPDGLAWLETIIPPEEMERLLHRPIVRPQPKPSNVIPLRKRRKRTPQIEQPMEAPDAGSGPVSF